MPVQETGYGRAFAQDHTPTTEVELGLVADQDQLERDHALAGGGRLDEQPAIELEREGALAARLTASISATTSGQRP